jgi:hypothetical protein
MYTSYFAVNLQIKFPKFGGVENIKFRLPLFIDRCRDLSYIQQKITSMHYQLYLRRVIQ